MKDWISSHLFSDGKLIAKRVRKEWFEKNHYTFYYNSIITNTSFLPTDARLPQRIWHICNPDIAYKCKGCGGDSSFIGYAAGYRGYCSNICAQNSEEVKNKVIGTNTVKYGAPHITTTESFKAKSKETILKKYGVDNVSKSKEIHQKKIDTHRKNFGTDYTLQSEVLREQIKNTNINKYGVVNAMQSDVIKRRGRTSRLSSEYNRFFNDSMFTDYVIPMFSSTEYNGIDTEYSFKCKRCGTVFSDILRGGKSPRCYSCYPNSNTSKGETEIADYITSLGYTIDRNSWNIIPPYQLDIYVPALQIAIEYNGLYYHSEVSGGKHKSYHIKKTVECENKGIRLIHVFEDEWLYKKEIVKSKLRSILGIKEQGVFARKCGVKILTSDEAREFLNSTHIQGNVPSNIHIGLMYMDTLVAVMSFSKRKVLNSKNEWEISRYSTSHTVIGGFNKLLSFFEKKYRPVKITSYALRNWSSKMNNIYTKNGFSLVNEGFPNFYYIKNGVRFNRIPFQKHKLKDKLQLFDSSKSEWENMKSNGYDRIWDCGSLKYEKVVK